MITNNDKDLEQLRRDVTAKDHKIAELEKEVQWFREQFKLAQHKLYGASSEKTLAILGSLFDEAELTADPDAPEFEAEPEQEVTVQVRKKKEKGHRDALLEKLPVEEITHSFSEEDSICKTCSGVLRKIGVDTRRELTVYPPRVVVTLIHTEKAVCDCCQAEGKPGPITKATAPVPAFPKSFASASSAAFAITQKYMDGMPLYRQTASFKRIGIDLSRQTLSNWVVAAADLLEVVYQRMRARLLQEKILHADETVLQVIKEQEKESRMWVYCTGRDGPPIYIYEYQPGRGRCYPEEFLKSFSGWLHTDGYVAYKDIQGVTLSGCWAHARRYYVDAITLLSPMERKNSKSPAVIGLEYCNALFREEKRIQDFSPEERHAARKVKSQRILDEYFAWAEETHEKALPKSPLGKAVGYSVNQKEQLIEFMNNGSLEISNNRAERAVKPFVIGRKNWLFSFTKTGASASSTLYSIMETAKANGLDPFRYMKHLFETLPNVRWEDETVDTLLPWNEEIQRICGL